MDNLLFIYFFHGNKYLLLFFIILSTPQSRINCSTFAKNGFPKNSTNGDAANELLNIYDPTYIVVLRCCRLQQSF